MSLRSIFTAARDTVREALSRDFPQTMSTSVFTAAHTSMWAEARRIDLPEGPRYSLYLIQKTAPAAGQPGELCESRMYYYRHRFIYGTRTEARISLEKLEKSIPGILNASPARPASRPAPAR